MKDEIIVVDIETTGFLNQGGLIVEIGIVKLNLRTGEIIELYNELVREPFYDNRYASSWIYKNSNLKHEDVCNAESFDNFALQDIFDKYPATAYNKDFDFGFLRDRGLEISELPCPMKIATNICKLPLNRYGNYKWPKVQEAWDFFFGKDTGYTEKHRGLDDAKHEAQIVYKLYQLGEFGIPE